jgi:hypothetical protein
MKENADKVMRGVFSDFVRGVKEDIRRPFRLFIIILLVAVGTSASISLYHFLRYIYDVWIVTYNFNPPIHKVEEQKIFFQHFGTSLIMLELFRILRQYHRYACKRMGALLSEVLEVSLIVILMAVILLPYEFREVGASNIGVNVLAYTIGFIVLYAARHHLIKSGLHSTCSLELTQE